MSEKPVNLYWALGAEWGNPLDASEIFAAESPGQAFREMQRYVDDPHARAIPLTDADLQVLHRYEGDGQRVPRSEALRLYLNRGYGVPFYFETSETN